MIDTAEGRVFKKFMQEHHRLIENEYGVCFFLRLDDEALDTIRQNKALLTNPETIKPYLTSEGDNLHLIGLFLKDRFNIFEGLNLLIEKECPKSISWYSRDMDRFIYRRLECLHH